MTSKTRNILGITVGALALIMIAAGASAFITKEVVKEEKPAPVAKYTPKKDKEVVHWNNPPAQQPQRVAAACDDGNVVGYGIGALAGGLIGNQIGDGKGKDVATVGGAAVGALAGGQYIPTRGVLCRR